MAKVKKQKYEVWFSEIRTCYYVIAENQAFAESIAEFQHGVETMKSKIIAVEPVGKPTNNKGE